MKISTKGRYAIRVMIDLAEHNTGDYITLMDIAKRQQISEKYLEGIVSTLSKKGIVSSLRGKGGGYRLSRRPDQYPVGEILRLMEGSLAPIACLETEENHCARAEGCKTLKMWTDFFKLTNQYFDSVTVQDLLDSNPEVDSSDFYVI